MSRHSKKCKHPVQKYDYVIVGAGTAGAALAYWLSQDCKTSVLVIEGGDDRRDDPVVSLNEVGGITFPTDDVVELHWHHPVQFGSFPNNQLDSSFQIYTEGRMWGGSSGHNYMLAVRGSPDIYNAWATGTGESRWAYDQLLPAMRYLETYTPNGTPIDTAQRGILGPLYITQLATNPGSSFYTATGTVNAPYKTDYNNPTLGDVLASAGQIYTPPNLLTRSYAATAFLGPDVVDEDGYGVCGRKLTIVSHAIAHKVLVECSDKGPKAIGVRYYQAPANAQNKEPCEPCENIIDAHARCKVILCAGAIQDPQILQRSGIGPKDVLDPLGIEVIVDNPNVGRNIQNHYGPFAFILSNPGDPIPSEGVQVFVDLSGPHTGPPTGIRQFQLLINTNGGILAFNLRPAALGTVEIKSSDPTVPALTQLHFLEDEGDIQDMIKVLKVIADISLAYTGIMPFAPSADLYPNTFPGGTFPDDSGLRSYVLNFSNIVPTNHISGSTRMSASASNGVVDGDLNVFGVRHLAVASNSVAPEIETGNTAYQAYIIGLIKAKIEGADVPF